MSLYNIFSGQIEVDKIIVFYKKIDYLDRVKRFDVVVIRTKSSDKKERVRKRDINQDNTPKWNEQLRINSPNTIRQNTIRQLQLKSQDAPTNDLNEFVESSVWLSVNRQSSWNRIQPS